MMKSPSSLCQLATVYHGKMPDKDGAMVERKMDGWRFLWIKGQPFTRNGIPMRGVGHIERALELLQAQYDCPMMFDGELVVGSGIDTLAQTKMHCERGWRGGDAGMLHLFDAVPMAQWNHDDCPMPLYARKLRLAEAIGGMMTDPLSWEYAWGDGVQCPVKMVADLWAFNARDVESMARDVWAMGGEGVIVKDAMAPYRRNRSPSWAKYRRDIKMRIAA
jgi:ATP-dependent DNA ligase